MHTRFGTREWLPTESVLVEYARTLYRRKFLILAATAAAGTWAYFGVQAQTTIYRARASVETLRPGNTLTIRSDWDIPTRSSAWQMRRSIQKRALLELVLERVKAYHAGSWSGPKQGGMFGKGEVSLDEALAAAASSLKVRETHAAGIVNILCDSPDPVIAAEFANTLVDQYIQDTLKTRWSGAQYDSAWIEDQLRELKARMGQTGIRLQQYARDTVLLDGGKTSLAFHELSKIKDRVLKARMEREKIQLRYELAERTDADALSRVLQDNRLGDMESELSELEAERGLLLHTLLPEHASVRKLQMRIDQLQARVTADRAALRARVQNEYESAVNIEQALAESYDRQARLISGGSTQTIAYAILRQEMDNDLSMYEMLLQQSKLGAVISTVMAPNLRVVDFAQPPRRPFKPNTKRNVMAGIVNGLFLSAALILLKEHVNRTLRAPGDVARSAGVPELGAIPAVRGRDPIQQRREHQEIAEAYSTCAENILLRHRGPAVVLVSSPERSDARAATAVHLAMAIAAMNRRALVVDADVKAPRLNQLFGIPNDGGFSDYLKGTIAEATPQRTAVPDVMAIPAGRRRATVSLLVREDAKIAALIERTRSEFDVVLVIAPAALSGDGARLLARHADSSVLTLTAGRSTRAGAIAAGARLAADGGRAVGGVLVGYSKGALRYADPDAYCAAPGLHVQPVRHA